MMNDFMKNASGLTKNPLGIIALFISLIYGFACIVLGTSLTNMSAEEERLPLIWFIILFPILILGAFIFLVVYHHEKLYSPSDFRNDEGFMQALNKKRVKSKIKKEAETLENADSVEEEQFKSKEDDNNSSEPNQDSNNLNDNTKQQKTNEISLTITDSENLMSKFTNAENWAAKEIGLKYNLSTKVNQSFVTKYGKFELDFIGNDSENVYIAEIKYWEANKSTKNLKISLQEFLRKYDKLESAFSHSKKFNLVIAIVFDKLEDHILKDLTDFVQKINDKVKVEFYNYSELKKDHEN